VTIQQLLDVLPIAEDGEHYGFAPRLVDQVSRSIAGLVDLAIPGDAKLSTGGEALPATLSTAWLASSSTRFPT